MEAFGKVHPSHRSYHQWGQMEEKERKLHIADMAKIYVDTAERYEHSAILMHPNPGGFEETVRLIDAVRDLSGSRYFLLLHGDATFSIPNGAGMAEFSYRVADDREGLHREADRNVTNALAWAEKLRKHGELDGFALCADYCFNTGPFLRPSHFSDLITPYLARLIAGYRDMGFFVIKHTDGNIMPIVEDLVQCNPHALHSLDPQGGVDMAVMKERYGSRVCLIGNVNCGALDTGTDEEVIASVEYALTSGMPNYGYIFSTSNCIYTGMRLARYDLMLDAWRRKGNYPVA
jgi:uroporphyrinogen decarboxylase